MVFGRESVPCTRSLQARRRVACSLASSCFSLHEHSDRPGCPEILGSRQATLLSFLDYLKGMSVASVTSTFGDFLSEAGFF
jgi:hypothetical protein